MQLRKIAAFAVLVATTAFAQAQTLNVAVAGQRTLKVPGLQRVALGDSSIADVRTIGNDELVLTGSARGQTTLLVWKQGVATPDRYQVDVTGPGTVTAPPTAAIDTTPVASFSPTLTVGEKVVKTVPGLQRIAVGDADIADIATGGTTVTVHGLKVGQTTVLLWHANGQRERWDVKVTR